MLVDYLEKYWKNGRKSISPTKLISKETNDLPIKACNVTQSGESLLISNRHIDL